MEQLTKRQAEALHYIEERIEVWGYPPTIREIGEHMGIKSTNGVADHLKALKRKGYLTQRGGKSRTLTPTSPPTLASVKEQAAVRQREAREGTMLHSQKGMNMYEQSGMSMTSHRSSDTEDKVSEVDFSRSAKWARGISTSKRSVALRGQGTEGLGEIDANSAVRVLVPGSEGGVIIPILGRVAAGEPILAEEEALGHVVVDSFLVGKGRKLFALRVVGQSMIEAGILDGDYIFVRKQQDVANGDIVVVMIEGEATVKHYHLEGDQIRLQPANAAMHPIFVKRSEFKAVQIMGRVVGVHRQI